MINRYLYKIIFLFFFLLSLFVFLTLSFTKDGHYVEKVSEEVSKETYFEEESVEETEIKRDLGEAKSISRESMQKKDPVSQETLEPIPTSQIYSSDELTKEMVLYYTNMERSKLNIQILKSNHKLDLAAEMKVDDMFERQYFAHNDPDGGMSAGFLSDEVDYEYLLVGENLAVGKFVDEEELVGAWMDSEGHRLNILNDKYYELGVAVKKGEYEGREVLMSVQIFARPLSDCSLPDSNLESTIDNNSAVMDILSDEIESLREDLDSGVYRSRHEHNQVVLEYNSLVQSYNQLLEQTQILIDTYNQQIEIFNNCANS